MKPAILFCALLVATNGHTQSKFWKHAILATSGIIAGVADGQREVIVHNPWAYRYRHPNANEAWWNPDSTWKKADRYPGMLVFLADKYHLNQGIRTAMFSVQTGFVVSLSLDEFKRKGKIRAGKVALYILEGQASYWLAKGLTHKYYDVFR
jgi:hypothetical protein